MARLRSAVEERLAASPHPELAGRLLWSYDNDKIHQDIILQSQLRIGGRNRAPLPPYSHDIHRVVEHTLGRLKRRFNLWLYTHPQQRSMQDYMRALQHIFYSIGETKAIADDVASLPSVYRAIKKAKGDWPPRSFQ